MTSAPATTAVTATTTHATSNSASATMASPCTTRVGMPSILRMAQYMTPPPIPPPPPMCPAPPTPTTPSSVIATRLSSLPPYSQWLVRGFTSRTVMVTSSQSAYFVPQNGHLPFAVSLLTPTADPRLRRLTTIMMAVLGHSTDSTTALSLLPSQHWFLSKLQIPYHRSHHRTSCRRASSASSPSCPSSPRDSDSSPCCSTALYTCTTSPTRNKSQHP